MPTTAQARVSFQTVYPDALGRPVAAVDYGTNGGTALTRPATVPARSDTALVSTTAYNDRGEACLTTDPKATHTALEFDHAGRLTRKIENSQSNGQPSTASRVTEFEYNSDGKLVTLRAKNSVTGDQETCFVYGVEGSASDVASHDLLREKIYRDCSGLTLGGRVTIELIGRSCRA